MRRRTVLAGATMVVAGLALVPACGNSSKGQNSSGITTTAATTMCKKPDEVKDTPSQIAVTLKEWSIGIDPPLVRAGKVSFIATNAGQNAHELIIVKSLQTAPIPLAADGSIDEAKIDPGVKVGAIPVLTPGKTCGAEFNLAAGNYLLFCNIVAAGTVHYKNGMVTLLTVVP